ncbi:MAG: PspC domain-containing protein [Bacteroidetes bacterium]|nr:PspC domain-containing protein [Bacteroidota bacterium]
MKKTIKINISGQVFHIDEDAYERLSKYLDKLKMRFRGTPGEQEILADIEARIAEIFQTRTGDDKESIVLEDVEEAIGILGEPEDFADVDDEEKVYEESQQERHYSGSRRKLYRDNDSKGLGGVCSGIGEYFGIDPIIVRILFVVFFLAWGAGLLIYILLWIAIPEARTTAEKLEMKGENINISNIEKSIRKEYHEVKDNLKNIPQSEGYRRAQRGVSNVGHGIGHVFVVFFKVIGAIIGVSFVIAGIALLVAIIGGLVAGQTWFMGDLWDWQQFSVPDVMGLFLDESVAVLAVICLLIIIGIPVLALIYGGVKLLFPFRAHDKAIGLGSLGVWIVALVFVAIFGASEAMKYNESERVIQKVDMEFPEKNLYLMVAETEYNYPKQMQMHFGYRHEMRVSEQGDNLVLLGMPTLDIVKSYDSIPELAIKRESRGVNDNVALRNAQQIQFNYTIRDSLLIIDPFFRLGKDEKWRDQELELTISLPVGYRIFLDESTREYLQGVDNQEDLWSEHMVGYAWTMEDRGLTRVDKDTD